MANWSLPTITDLYTNFLAYLKTRDDDAARMFDTRAEDSTNGPDYTKRWNDTTKTFQEWTNAIGQWANLILGVAGGGTGAANATDARTNLGVYSTAQVDAAITAASSLTSSSNPLGGSVALTSASTYYTGPSLSLAAGTYLIMGSVNVLIIGAAAETIYVRLGVGVSYPLYASEAFPILSASATRSVNIPIMYLATFGSAETVAFAASKTSANTCTIQTQGSYVHAVKIA